MRILSGPDSRWLTIEQSELHSSSTLDGVSHWRAGDLIVHSFDARPDLSSIVSGRGWSNIDILAGLRFCCFTQASM